MGLLHEHQRPDRDAYLSYKCENVRGHDEVKKKAEDEKVSRDDVCNSAEKCSKYSFAGHWFTKDFYQGLSTLRGPLDQESIM